MEKQNIEVEGGELLIQSKEGHYAVIPAKHRQEVMDMVKDGCDDCINNYIQTLPKDSDYAEDGTLIEKIKGSKLNPKNWGVPDYTDKGSRGTAYAAARKAGEKEFMWNNQRFNTNYDGTPQQQLKETGITNDRLGIQGKLENRAYNTVKPSIYNDDDIGQNIKNFVNNRNRFDTSEYSDLSKQLVEADKNNDSNKVKKLLERLNTYSNDYVGLDDPYSEDAWRIYLGKPQTKNTFNISNYKPTKGKDVDRNYYGLPEVFKEELFNLYSSKQIEEGVNSEFSFENVFGENSSRARVLGNFTVNKGKDERGEYISYYDKYDLSPRLPIVGKTEVSNYVGKPFEIYDRIYTKDYGDGKQKRMYYTDKELSELNINKKDFDTLGLQRELSNRGYKLPESTKQDGSLDGIWGDETKNALLDWRNKQPLDYSRPKTPLEKALFKPTLPSMKFNPIKNKSK